MDFDAVIDRKGTGALKWNSPSVPGKDDVIPLWVADMDFPAPKEVTEALRRRAEHPIYGYTQPDPALFRTLQTWYAERYGAEVEVSDFLLGPGVVPSLAIAARTFAAQGEGVLILGPVYFPFTETVRDNGRIIVEAPLAADETGRFRFDPDAAARALDEAEARGIRVKVLFFCSPHNPGGIVWKREELAAVLEFAKSRNLLMITDEIHGDIVYPPNGFVSMSDFPGAAERTIVVSTANKTFNIAGLHLSHFVVRNAELRARIKHGIAAAGYSQPNAFSLAAVQAAYGNCGPWLDELLAYLKGNIDFAVRSLNGEIRGMAARTPEGTYLIWADARKLIAEKGLKDDRELVARLESEARIKLTPGSAFGAGGKGFVRVNVACPRAQLSEGLKRWAAWAEGGSR